MIQLSKNGATLLFDQRKVVVNQQDIHIGLRNLQSQVLTGLFKFGICLTDSHASLCVLNIKFFFIQGMDKIDSNFRLREVIGVIDYCTIAHMRIGNIGIEIHPWQHS